MSRRARSGGEGDDDAKDAKDPKDAKDAKDAPKEEASKAVPASDRSADETAPVLMTPRQRADEPKDIPDIVPPDPKAEPWPDATPPPMKPVEPARARTDTETIVAQAEPFGRPPDMPTTTAPPPLALGAVEDPTHMPGPRDIPGGEPADPAPAPGRVPPGDSRSLRRSTEFALVYRIGTYVISRTGTLGTRGQWRVVEYPTSSSASHAYAKECSRFVSDGFSDYRE